MLEQIKVGRTDIVFEYLAAGNATDSTDAEGVSLLQWCAYYGDVSAMKYLLSQGASLQALGENLDLNGAVFHGHWQLCLFLIENGADVNYALPDSGESLLHAALCKANSPAHELVIKVLLAKGANPNCVTKPNFETGGFMRDSRTKGETPLHRAAAFGSAATIQMLLDAGAKVDVKDMNGDSPLSWASWYLRPDEILRKLCYDSFRIRPDRPGMDASLRGTPQV